MREKILEIIRPILGENASMETSMDNTPAWDSIKTLQMVMALDEADIGVPFEHIAEIRSVADIVAFAAGD